jgi:hypothetical protein
LRKTVSPVRALCAGLLIIMGAAGGNAAEERIKTFVFEEQRIEGKIRRPQLVLIKADQRPDFEPMAIRIFGKNKNIVDFVDRTVLEASPYDGPFQVEGGQIANRIP